MLTIDQLQKVEVRKNSLGRYNVIKLCMVMSRRMAFSMTIVVKWKKYKAENIFVMNVKEAI